MLSFMYEILCTCDLSYYTLKFNLCAFCFLSVITSLTCSVSLAVLVTLLLISYEHASIEISLIFNLND